MGTMWVLVPSTAIRRTPTAYQQAGEQIDRLSVRSCPGVQTGNFLNQVKIPFLDDRLMGSSLDTRTAPDGEAVYLFSGLLVCGCCGARMTRKTNKPPVGWGRPRLSL